MEDTEQPLLEFPNVEFPALEYGEDQSFREAVFRYDGSPESGWTVSRNGAARLRLGPGYRLLRTERCGVCSTDLVRHRLPFPLPQVTGHELIATDADGRRLVVEINASHRARGRASECPFCTAGLHTHCPDRLVLGIHDLPGGFGPWVLAPVDAVLPVPDVLSAATAVLVEPFAAALHAVTRIDPQEGDRIAVLGPRRLGLLVVAALQAYRQRTGRDFGIEALSRRPHLLDLARRLGATGTRLVEGDGSHLPPACADVVIDTTGAPSGSELAIRLARREVHLKSTHGQAAAGVDHLTELVVDELAIDRLPEREPGEERWAQLGSGAPGSPPRVAWLVDVELPSWLVERADVVCAGDAATALRTIAAATPRGALPRADLAVVAGPDGVADAIRPGTDQASLVRPRGEIWLHPQADARGSGLCAAVVDCGLRVSSSRCGDFRAALELMAADPLLRRLGELLVTHGFPAGSLPAAFATAGSPDCIKAVVEHRRDAAS